nr:TPA_asm: hypothetical protein [Phamor tricladivirus]
MIIEILKFSASILRLALISVRKIVPGILGSFAIFSWKEPRHLQPICDFVNETASVCYRSLQ